MTAQFIVLYTIWGKKYGGLGAAGQGAVRLCKIIAVSAIGAGGCYLISSRFENIIIVDNRRIQAIITCAAASIPS
jgi:hypothetical protein